MNYQQTIKYSYSDIPIPSAGDSVLLLADNQSYIVVDDMQSMLVNQGLQAPTYEELLMFASGISRNQYNSNSDLIGLLYHPYYTDYWNATALITASKIDFVTIHTDNQSIYVSDSDMVDAMSPAFINRNDNKQVYPQFNYSDSYESYSYGNFTYSMPGGEFLTYDYSALKNNQYFGTGFNEFRNRDNGVDYNYTFLSLGSATSSDGLYLYFGSPLHDMYKQGYDVGNSFGYSTGYVNGFDDGYHNGVIAGGASTETATAFSYITQAFNAVGGIMSLEVLPNITIGLVWSIPLVFILIMTIFKLIRK